MWNKIIEWIRSLVNRMFSQANIKQALGIEPTVSAAMTSAMQLWDAMYKNTASWINTEIKSMNLPATIASEIARMVTIEMSVKLSGSPRAEFLQMQMDKVLSEIREQVEYGNAKGGLIIKPYVKDGALGFNYAPADCFYPRSWDGKKLTGVVIPDVRKVGQYWYTRLEMHQMSGTNCIIRNSAYKSSTENALGNPCQLADVADWATLPPEATITNVTQPLYGYFRYPGANNVDPTSPLSVSCYSRAQTHDGAVRLIEQADEIYSNLVWEFYSGKRVIYADETAFDSGSDGLPRLPDKRLFRTLKNLAQIGKEEHLFEAWTPEFRDASIKSGLDAVLKKIEFVCGLSYGVISDPQTVAMTATEIKSSQQRLYSTVTDTQKSLQNALDGLLYAMNVYADIYGLAPAGDYVATYDFDDSVITDKNDQFSKDMQTKNGGMMPAKVFLMRNYGLDEETALQWVADKQAEDAAKPDPFGFGNQNA